MLELLKRRDPWIGVNLDPDLARNFCGGGAGFRIGAADARPEWREARQPHGNRIFEVEALRNSWRQVRLCTDAIQVTPPKLRRTALQRHKSDSIVD